MTTAFQPNGFQANAFQVDPVTGVLYVVDQNDTGSFVGSVIPLPPSPNQMDMHDGISKEELKRIRALQKKIKKAEEARIQAKIESVKARKNAIADLVDPKVAKKVINEVELQAKVQDDRPSLDLRKINAEIRNLERQKEQLLQAVAYRQEIARIQAELAILEAKAKAERDDEEALLLLM